jgi:hypothetical protein
MPQPLAEIRKHLANMRRPTRMAVLLVEPAPERSQFIARRSKCYAIRKIDASIAQGEEL